jgi:hypothetical protein
LNPLDPDAKYNYSFVKAQLSKSSASSLPQQLPQPEKTKKESPQQPPLTPEEQERLLKQLAESENETLQKQTEATSAAKKK